MERAEAPRTMNPTKVFAVLAALILAIVGIVLLTRPNTAPPATESRTPDFSLTDTEAITRFEELDALRIQAIDSGDLSLIDEIFVDPSHVARTMRKTIIRLNRTGVSAIHNPYEIKSLRIVTNTDERVRVEQVVEFDIRFEGSAGESLTRKGGLERQTILWTMVLEADVWKLDAAQVTESKQLRE